VLRTALKPKWLALLALVVLIIVAFTQLGRWQLGVAQDKARAEEMAKARAQPPVALATLLSPHAPFPAAANARLAIVTGTYAEGQVLIPARLLAGRDGYWLLTPMTESATGVVFPVVRGWLPPAAGGSVPAPPPPPTGETTVVASLAPGESPTTESYPAGQLGSVDLARLVNIWPGAIYNAFGFAQREAPANDPQAADRPGALGRIPPPRPDTGLTGRNVAYALQWWVFAAFAFFLWIKMVQQDARQRRHLTLLAPPPGGAPTLTQEP